MDRLSLASNLPHGSLECGRIYATMNRCVFTEIVGWARLAEQMFSKPDFLLSSREWEGHAAPAKHHVLVSDVGTRLTNNTSP
jgi:hypothetical protein